jgi:hypothetical protein
MGLVLGVAFAVIVTTGVVAVAIYLTDRSAERRERRSR